MSIAAPFGTWASRVSASAVAAASVRLGHVQARTNANGSFDVYWTEGRPSEGGRTAIVRRRADGSLEDVTPPGANARTRVQEYGGGAYTIDDGVVYYAEFSDQRIYRAAPKSSPSPLTPQGRWYYADVEVDARRRRLVCVREDHTSAAGEPATSIVAIPMEGQPVLGRVLVSGYDFYSTPRLSPDGARLAWLAWRHPQMPWDGTELWVADVDEDGDVCRSALVAGGAGESVFQPGWSPDGELYFASDRTGWWNLYRAGTRGVAVVTARPFEVEFGAPQWQLGLSTWAFADDRTIVSAFCERGRWKLGTIDVLDGGFEPLDVAIEPTPSVAAANGVAIVIGGSSQTPDRVVSVDLTTGRTKTLNQPGSQAVDPALLAMPESIEFPTAQGRTAYAFFYPPQNPEYHAPHDERPPLLVMSHGGPTSATTARLSLEIQFWTSRGFAVVDVNYGGSTGFGREYRDRLKGGWGVVDVADCVNAALWLAEQGRADRRRVAIRGRSAGGFTTLSALTSSTDVFQAGASYYGVADLEGLASDTHKFESRYLDGLVGPYPAARELYRERSPIRHIDRLTCPVVFFQGMEDRVVPPDQARAMVDAVCAKAIPSLLVLFGGEQHGFRRADTIATCLEVELAFYALVFRLAVSR